jgi:3-hydroxybutyryl-CoA dehydrogenase
MSGITRVGVVGCGQMGSGIAEVCAVAGYQVLVADVDEPALQRGLSRIEASMRRAVERGRLSGDQAAAAFSRIRGTTDLSAFSDRDLIIEAVVEIMEEKKRVFSTLDRLCSPEAIFGTNTSSLSVTEMAASTSRPAKFVGIHFFNPVPVMQLVELVRTDLVDPAVLETARAFAESLGKKVVVSKDSPGFIVNLLLISYLMEAVRAMEQGVASMKDIDEAIKLGLGHPMGPFTLMDFIGIDTVYYIANVLYEEFKDDRFAPPPLLKRMVVSGRLGRKAGKGFYDYTPNP